MIHCKLLKIKKYWKYLVHKGDIDFHEFTVSYLKSRNTESNMFRKGTLILSLTYKKTSQIYSKFAPEVNKVRMLPKGFYKI